MEKELLHGTLEVLILKTLSWGPMHGFGIGRWIGQLSGDELRIEEGSLYPALYRLEKKGLVDASWGLSDNGRRAKFYRLTAEGRRQLLKNSDIWSGFAQAVARVLSAKQQPAVMSPFDSPRPLRAGTPLWRRYLRFWGADPAADVDDEFAFHLEMRIEELRAQGLSPTAARDEALRGFGNIQDVKRICRTLAEEREHAMRRTQWWSDWRHDLRFAIRQLTVSPC